MNKKDTWAWVIGIVVVLLIIGGVWWWVMTPAQTPSPAVTNTVATSTNAATVPASVSLVNKSSESVASILAGFSSDSSYASLLSSTGVGSTLSGKGPYTVFVSTDAGFNLLPPATVANMTASQRKRMAQYSIISGRALNIDAQDTGSIKTLSGDELNFSVGPGNVVQVNSSYALQEYKASNGVVYVINQPLLPPTSKNILTP
ncbi:MAG TPA: fasciclin domain-containing protein [Candidatus Paceibacterota bacterium]